MPTMSRLLKPKLPNHCSFCEKVFTNLGKLKKHNEQFHRDRLFSCHYCDKSYEIVSDLDYHIAYVHEGVASNPHIGVKDQTLDQTN